VVKVVLTDFFDIRSPLPRHFGSELWEEEGIVSVDRKSTKEGYMLSLLLVFDRGK
jgi:hypothetical protein